MAVYGTGNIFQRGRIWYYSYYDGETKRMVSSKSERKKRSHQTARTHPETEDGRDTARPRNQEDRLRRTAPRRAAACEGNGKPSTAKIWEIVIDANLRFLWKAEGGEHHNRKAAGVPRPAQSGGTVGIDVQPGVVDPAHCVQSRAQMHASES
jgi:hypothetical protein